jgi:peroxiredoxin
MIAKTSLLIACRMGLLLLCSTTAAMAGEFNEVLSIGDAAPAWKSLPGTDGERHSLSDLDDRDVVVVVFSCVSCPTAVDYESRISELAERAAKPDSRIAVVVICVNKVPQDQLPALIKHQKQQKLAFHYLYDETQQVAKDFGAIFTPECFVLNRDRKVIYMGALDDSTDPAKVQQRYLDDAVAAGLKGEHPKTTEIIARGCRVRYARERRSSE